MFDHPTKDLALHVDNLNVDPDVHMQAVILGPSLSFTFRSEQGVREFYDSVDPKVYDELMRQMNFNEPYYAVHTLISQQYVRPDWPVLDVGCATGKVG